MSWREWVLARGKVGRKRLRERARFEESAAEILEHLFVIEQGRFPSKKGKYSWKVQSLAGRSRGLSV